MAKKKKNPEAYCLTAFNSLNANRDQWNCGDSDFFRPITRIMYEAVVQSGYDRLDFISERAFQDILECLDKNISLGKCKTITYDHHLSPQFCGRMVMDNPEKYLDNYEDFKKVFYAARQVVLVTKKENSAVASLSQVDQKTGRYIVYKPTDEKYKTIESSFMKHSEKLNNPARSKWDQKNLPENLIVSCELEEVYGGSNKDVIRDLLKYEERYLEKVSDWSNFEAINKLLQEDCNV